jgi:CheY-like chemotaxis protein
VLKTRNGAIKSDLPVAKTVLVIDDNPERFRAVQTALAGAGYAVEIASEAQVVDARLHARRPDFILADLELPGIDGLPLARSLLVDPEWDGVPVVALTHDPADGEQRQKLEDLFDGYCSEPLDPAALIRQRQGIRLLRLPKRHRGAIGGCRRKRLSKA